MGSSQPHGGSKQDRRGDQEPGNFGNVCILYSKEKGRHLILRFSKILDSVSVSTQTFLSDTILQSKHSRTPGEIADSWAGSRSIQRSR